MLRCLVPPSVGTERARARGEILERALQRVLQEDVRVEVAESYRELEERLARGEVELAWAPAAILARIEAATGALHSAHKVLRSGRSSYRSAIIVRDDSPREALGDLRGARAGWVDPLSLGGCLLALEHLRQSGFDPAELASTEYLGTHPLALAAVVERRTDVTAVSVAGPWSEDVANALRLHAGIGAKVLRSLAVTDPAPTDAFVLTDVLPLERAQAMEQLLFGKRQGSALCLAMETEGFEKAERGEYARLQRLLPER
jgi:ABC-type phosphate/phosphonate transport system substrate-binding protein